MPIDFDSLASTAGTLIAENGRALVLKRGTAPTAQEFDPVTGAPGPANDTTTTSWNVRGVVLTMTSDYVARVGQSNIGLADQLVMIGPAIEPHQSDVLAFDDEDWQVVRVEELAPNGTKLYYICQVRP
jgi:hypothetical protein